jgi:hypothetical protein
VSSLAALRAHIAAVVAPPPVVADTIATGIAALDRVLPEGGVPCGRLTELAGAAGHGKTTVGRALVASALAEGRWVAWIDGTRTLAPGDWAALAATRRLWIVRPPRDDRATWCADVLLRSGAFGLVVLDSAQPVRRQIAVRLTRLARESNAAFVVLRDEASQALTGGALRIRLCRHRTAPPPSQPRPWRSLGVRLGQAVDGRSLHVLRRPVERAPDERTALTRYVSTVTLTLEKGAGNGSRPHVVEVHCATDLPRRLRTDPEVPDRRGVAKRNRRGELAAPDAPGVRRTTPAADGTGATLPRKRRCAEPDVRRDEFLLTALGRDSHRAERQPASPLSDRSGRTRKNPRRDDRERGTLAVRRVAGAGVE